MTRRISLRRATISVTMAFAFAQPAAAGTASQDHPALSAALALCTSKTALQESAADTLAVAGWQRQPEPDYSTTTFDMGALSGSFFSMHFAFNYDASSSEKMHYSLANSVFMMGSILGNSALRQSPPTLTAQEMTLLLVALKLDRPYCILTGPAALADWVKDWSDYRQTPPTRHSTSPARAYFFGELGGATIIGAALDLPALKGEIQRLTLEPPKDPLLPEGIREKLVPNIRAVNLHINPSPSQ